MAASIQSNAGTGNGELRSNAGTLALSWSDSLLMAQLPLTTPTATPASAGAAGTAGQFAWDASYIYICTATNTWKRVGISTW